MPLVRGPLFVCIRMRPLAAVLAVALLAAAGVWAIGFATGRGLPAGVFPGHAVLSGLVVAVDAGHGGQDRGACFLAEGLVEKEINLDVAGRVGERLERLGARVVMVRSDDAFVELDERAKVANEAAADVLVSIHVNRIPGHPDCYGAQVFYFPGREASERLAALIQEELVAVDPDNYRRALPGEYRILRLAQMPAAIVEIGFITNERDRGLLASSEYRDRVAGAIVSGIARFALETRGESPVGQGGPEALGE